MDEHSAGGARRRRPAATWLVAATLGSVLMVGGAAALGLGLASDNSSEKTVGILGLVLGLACVRAYRWARRAQLLAQVARDLHSSG